MSTITAPRTVVTAPPIRSRHWPRKYAYLPLRPLREALWGHVSIARLSTLCGVCTRTACRMVVADEISDLYADRAAIALGLHPALIWGPAWWDLDGEVV